MKEMNKQTEKKIRKLTKKEMARVEGGVNVAVDPSLQCPYCQQCFGSKVELLLHMNNCGKKKK